MPGGWMLTRFWSIIATGAESPVGWEQRQVSAIGLVSDKGLPIHVTGAESPGCGQEARVWPGVNQEVRSQSGGSHEAARRLGVG